MKKKDVNRLTTGLYRIHWKDGDISVGAIGKKINGNMWLAPTNWVKPSSGKKAWRRVKSMEEITTHKEID